MFKQTSPELVAQIERIYKDQRNDLDVIREQRREIVKRIVELDSREIDLLLGLEETAELLRNLKGSH